MGFAVVFHATTCTNIFRPSRQQCSSPPPGLSRRDWSTVVLSARTGCRLPAHLRACVWHFPMEVFTASAVSTQLEHIFQVLAVSKGCSDLSDTTAFHGCELGASMTHTQRIKVASEAPVLWHRHVVDLCVGRPPHRKMQQLTEHACLRVPSSCVVPPVSCSGNAEIQPFAMHACE